MEENGALDEHRLRELIEVGRALMAELDPEALLERVLEVACELTGARYAALGVLDSDRHELERFITRGIDEETRRAIGNLPRGRGVLGLLIEQPRPLRLSDVGEHPRSYGFPAGHPPMRSFLGVPILIRGHAWGNLYLTEKAGGDFDAADEQAAVILAEWAAIAVENARLYSDVEGQRDRLERAVRGLEATTEIGRALGGETDLERILETIVKRGRALVDARSLLILLREGDELRLAAAAGEIGRDAELRLPLEGSIPGQALEARRPRRLASIGADLLSRPSSEPGQAALLVPLGFRGQDLGVLAALGALGHDGGFSDEDEQVLDSFASSAAMALATAQSVAEDRLRESIEATERERGRWARELHDEALQSMAGLRVLLNSAQRDADEKTARLLAESVERIDHTIAEMRRLIADLRPATLDELGLAAALEALVERATADGALAVHLTVELSHEGSGEARLVRQIEDAAYRMVQEALNNTARHAEAASVQVEVSEDGGLLRVRIADDGQGFDPGRPSEGFGLRGMAERVELAGGTLEVRSEPGEGTTVVATLPASHRQARAA